MMNVKKCSNCFKFQPLSEFYRKLKRYQARCIDCNNEVCAGYRERARRQLVKDILSIRTVTKDKQ